MKAMACKRVFIQYGLNQKDSQQKVIFGSIQSVAKAAAFFRDFTLLVIDECHHVGLRPESQYAGY